MFLDFRYSFALREDGEDIENPTQPSITFGRTIEVLWDIPEAARAYQEYTGLPGEPPIDSHARFLKTVLDQWGEAAAMTAIPFLSAIGRVNECLEEIEIEEPVWEV